MVKNNKMILTWSFFIFLMFTVSRISTSIRLFRTRVNPVRPVCFALSSGGATSHSTGDLLSQGLNGAQDISVKAVSCKEIVQECILKNDLSPQAAQALGELLVSALMMGSSLKGEETLQINIVGNTGLMNMMAITDGKLQIRGMVGQPRYEYQTPSSSPIIATGPETIPADEGAGANKSKILPPTRDLLGTGQIQVVRSHPSWKRPMNGIVNLRDVSIPLNIALYMAESEQRPAALLTDVQVEGNLCRCALGVMVERLPGCSDENMETSIRNLEVVQKKGLRSYLKRSSEKRNEDASLFRDFEPVLDSIIDDCIATMDENSFRWSKVPSFRCSCGIDKVWRTLRLLPNDDVQHIIDANETVEMKCEFCGTKYSLSAAEIRDTLYNQ